MSYNVIVDPFGNSSNFSLSGTSANDAIYGYGGNDTLQGFAGIDLLDGGSGIDTALFRSGIGWRVDLNTSYQQDLYGNYGNFQTGTAISGGSGTDLMRDIENVTTGTGNDTLIGNSSSNFLNGGGGRDTLTGNGGNDHIIGGSGTDTAVYSYNYSSYNISQSGDDLIVSRSSEGTDRVYSDVEYLQFSDGTKSRSQIIQDITQPQEPDLVVTNISLNDTSLQAGQSLTVSWRVRNEGDDTASSSTTAIFLNNGSQSWSLGTVSTSSISANGYRSQSTTVTIPDDISSGSNYRIAVYADIYSNVDESIEYNNQTLSQYVTVQSTATPPNLTITDDSELEGNNLVFTVRIDQDASQDLRVFYITSDGTATAGEDFAAPASSAYVTIQTGQRTAQITIATIEDTQVEPDQSFTVTVTGVSDTSGNSVTVNLTDRNGTGTIENDDIAVPSDDFADSKDDSSAPVGSVAVNSSATGVIEEANDRDWFRLNNLIEGNTYKIEVDGANIDTASALINTFFTVRDVDGNRTMFGANYDWYDDINGTNAVLEYTASSDGTHYIAIGAGGDSYATLTGGYRLSVDDVSNTAPPVITDSGSSTGSVGVGGSYEETIDINVSSWGDLQIQLTELHQQAVVLAQLIDQYGNTVAEGQQSGTTLDIQATDLNPEIDYELVVSSHGINSTSFNTDIDHTPVQNTDGKKTAAEIFHDESQGHYGKLSTLADFAKFAYSDSVYVNDAGWTNKIYKVANAAVLVVDSDDAVFVAFRGTAGWSWQDPFDFLADWAQNIINLESHYSQLRTAIEQINQTIADRSEDGSLKKVYVTGHSLGAAMATAFMSEHANDTLFEAVTFANPGFQHPLNSWGTEDSRITNIWTEGDPILAAKTLKTIKDVFGLVDNPGLNRTPGDQYMVTHQDAGTGSLHSMDLYQEIAQYLDQGRVGNFLDQSSQDQITDKMDIPLSINNIGTTDVPIWDVGPPPSVHDDSGRSNVHTGGTGNDSYHFAGGKDTIIDRGGASDEIILDILSSSLFAEPIYGYRGNDLVIKFHSTSQITSPAVALSQIRIPQSELVIQNHFYNSDSRIEHVNIGGVRTDLPTSKSGLKDFGYVAVTPDIIKPVWDTSGVVVGGAADLGAIIKDSIADFGEHLKGAGISLVASLNPATNTIYGVLQIAKSFFNSSPQQDLLSPALKSLLASSSTDYIEVTLNLDNISHIIGTDGDDDITGNDSSNWLSAGAGDDIVRGGKGDDTIIGGSGEGDDIYDGGDDIDTVIYSSATQDIIVNLTTGSASGAEIGSDTLSNIENVIGGSGSDTITGNALANTLFGDAGNDKLYGGTGKDQVSGGDGDDLLVYTGGFDTYDGGADTDTADFSALNSGIWVGIGRSGVDAWNSDTWETLAEFSSIENVIGTDYGDKLIGNATANNQLFGGAGNDILAYTGGFDTYDGGADTDTADFSALNTGIWVGVGRTGVDAWNPDTWETLAEFNSIENVIGTDHADKIIGNAAANNKLFGGAGNDILAYTGGFDTYDGGADTDTADFSALDTGIWVGVGRTGVDAWNPDTWETLAEFNSIENVIGTDHADKIIGNAAANNKLFGGAGQDILAYTGGFDLFDGGADTDTADFSALNTGIWVGIGRNGVDAWNPDTWETLAEFNSIENVIGTDYADKLIGNAAANNKLFGGAGEDLLVYTGGFDTYDGGADTDTADFSTLDAGVWISIGRTGIDAWNRDTWETLAELTNIENIIGTAHDDKITGNAADNLFAYTGGYDEFYGEAGSDTADFSDFDTGIWVGIGRSGVDAWNRDTWNAIAEFDSIENVIGTIYADKLIGSSADNTLTGGAGEDLLVYSGGFDLFDGGADTDTADFSALDAGVWISIGRTGIDAWNRDTWETLAELTNIENIIGTAHDDKITGNAADNSFAYTGGYDEFYGEAGSDTADFSGLDAAIWVGIGRAGTDAWNSQTWNAIAEFDSIENVIGTIYADKFIGSTADNTLAGGAGTDLFVFNGAFGNDIITDFANGTELLDVSNANNASAANLHVALGASGNVVVDFGGPDSIELVGITDIASIDATDFLF